MECRQILRMLAAVRPAVTPRYPALLPRFVSTTRVLQQADTPKPSAPWHRPRSESAEKLRQSLQNNPVRSWDSLTPPRPPPGSNTFGEPSRSPLLAGRRKELLDSEDPTSVYGLMGHDMGLENHSLFSEGDFLSRHGKAAQTPEMRLRPSTGRMVRVAKKVDFARGLRLLDQRMRQNKVAADVQAQRFHERPGLKRKRQSSKRWIARFRRAFKHTVGRVNELRRQGW